MHQASHRAQVTFRGTVQGVGFRYRTCRIAYSHPDVTGAVRNKDDGSVTLTAEGTKEQIEAFISEVIESMAGYITDNEIRWSSGRQHYQAFVIES